MTFDDFFSALFGGARFECEVYFEPHNQEDAFPGLYTEYPSNVPPIEVTFDPGSIKFVPIIPPPGYPVLPYTLDVQQPSIAGKLKSQLSTHKYVHIAIYQEVNFFLVSYERKITVQYQDDGKIFSYTGGGIVDTDSSSATTCILHLGHGTKPFSLDCKMTLWTLS